MTIERRWHFVAGAVLCLVAVASSAGSQETRRRGKWWQSESMKVELGLTAEQSARIEEIFQATLPELRSARDRLNALQAELSRLLGDEAANESLVVRQVDQVERARSELSKLRTLMLFRMDRVLTPDQRVKMKSLHDRSDRRGNNQGPRHYE
jgi:Spy/CpxP family protein refolding chaperone